MSSCMECGVALNLRNSMPKGRCSRCHAKLLEKGLPEKPEPSSETSVAKRLQLESEDGELRRRMLLTTETYVGDVERLGIVATEVVLGMNIIRDIFANVRDIFGGRSGAVQKTLEDARTAAFDELREKAVRLKADAIISVGVDYHSISTGSAVNMLIVSVSGTAIKWRHRED